MINLVSTGFFSFAKDETKINQDAVLLPVVLNDGYLFAIADGVGSVRSSELASKVAVDTLLECKGISSKFDVENVLNDIRENIKTVSKSIDVSTDLATTITFAFVNEAGLSIGHVGDCRLYVKDNAKLRQITRDHTQYQILLDANIYTKKELKKISADSGVMNTLMSVVSPDIDPVYDFTFIPATDLFDEAGSFTVYIMSDGAYYHWHLRPRFSESTLCNPTSFCSSLLKRIERCGSIDDHSALAVKFKKTFR
ncbi:MAG: PP2C family protein-serine/threonine phosphatase [Plesiomonas shigelloides]